MVTSKTIELLGTKDLSGSDNIILYNTNTFKDESICEYFGISNTESEILSSEPTVDNISYIRKILSRYSEYDPISPAELSDENIEGEDKKPTFLFDNNKLNIITGQGFNVIIFLTGNSSIIGFMVLLHPVGEKQDDSNKSSYDLKRNYTLHNIEIVIDTSLSNIRIDKDVIQLLNNVEDLANSTNRDYSGNENYNYTIKSELNDNFPISPNYTKYVSVLLGDSKPKSIFQDNFICHHDKNSLVLSKLKIKKDITLDRSTSHLDNSQVGFYSGDIALFLWNNNTLEYTIISLTKSLEELYGLDIEPGTKLTPYIYLNPIQDEGINSHVHSLPRLADNQKIEYFAGRYVVSSINSTRYLFDVKDRFWVKYNDTETNTKEYLNEFIVDSMDPFSKVYKPSSSENGMWDWRDYIESIKKIPSISETYIDSSISMISQAKYPIRKIGDWIIYANDNCKVCSNMTKSITMSIDENDPIILNNQTLLTWETGVDEVGRSTITYNLYNRDGYFITKYYKSRSGITSDLESRGNTYKLNNNYFTITTSSVRSYQTSSPIEIQKSFFSLYRRNILPKTLEDFKVIGAFMGIIFYRVGNTINYL